MCVCVGGGGEEGLGVRVAHALSGRCSVARRLSTRSEYRATQLYTPRNCGVVVAIGPLRVQHRLTNVMR